MAMFEQYFFTGEDLFKNDGIYTGFFNHFLNSGKNLIEIRAETRARFSKVQHSTDLGTLKASSKTINTRTYIC